MTEPLRGSRLPTQEAERRRQALNDSIRALEARLGTLMIVLESVPVGSNQAIGIMARIEETKRMLRMLRRQRR
jgi:hypothetical protein